MRKFIYENGLLILTFLILLIFSNSIAKLYRNVDDEPIEKYVLEIENQTLRQELNYYLQDINSKLYTNYDYKISKLLFNNPYNLFNTGTILLGSKDDIVKDMVVLYQDNLIGTIDRVYSNISYIELLNNKDYFPIRINDNIGSICDFNNKNKTYKICNIDNYGNIKIGDIVYTSNYSAYPQNIKVGVVSDIKKEDKIEKEVYMKNNLDYKNINYVVVILR